MHRHDVRVVEPARDARLAQEARGEGGIGRVERRQLLQRDLAVEVGLPGEPDDGHAAAPDLLQELEAADRAQDLGHDSQYDAEARGITSPGRRVRGGLQLVRLARSEGSIDCSSGLGPDEVSGVAPHLPRRLACNRVGGPPSARRSPAGLPLRSLRRRSRLRRWVAPVSLSGAGDTIATPSVAIADGGLGIEAWSENNGTRRRSASRSTRRRRLDDAPGRHLEQPARRRLHADRGDRPRGERARRVGAVGRPRAATRDADHPLPARRPARASCVAAPARRRLRAATWATGSPSAPSNAAGQIVVG